MSEKKDHSATASTHEDRANWYLKFFWVLIILGVACVFSPKLLLIARTYFDVSSSLLKLQEMSLSDWGTYISGTTGAIFTLSGAVLIYASLLAQKADLAYTRSEIAKNQELHEKQISVLTYQTRADLLSKEFEMNCSSVTALQQHIDSVHRLEKYTVQYEAIETARWHSWDKSAYDVAPISAYTGQIQGLLDRARKLRDLKKNQPNASEWCFGSACPIPTGQPLHQYFSLQNARCFESNLKRLLFLEQRNDKIKAMVQELLESIDSK